MDFAGSTDGRDPAHGQRSPFSGMRIASPLLALIPTHPGELWRCWAQVKRTYRRQSGWRSGTG